MRQRNLVPVAWFLLFLVILCSPVRGQDLIVRGGWLFDAVGDASVRNTVIVIRGGKFARIGASAADVDLGAVPLIQLGDDDYILPGIFDLHAHYNIKVLGRGRIDETDHYSVIYLANGVTSTFPAGEYNPITMLEMRKRIDRGEQIGPRVYNSGPYYGQSMPRGRRRRKSSSKWICGPHSGRGDSRPSGSTPSSLRPLSDGLISTG